jgi:type IV pilus assembly protein PilX
MTRMTRPRARRARGVIIIYTLIILVILTIGAIALLKSMSTSLFGAGNMAFRHDLVNQGEQAVSNVLRAFQPGGAMAVAGITNSNATGSNYSSTALAANAQGVPTALLSNTAFGTVGAAGNDIAGATADVNMRYVVDRLCNTTGPSTPTACVQAVAGPPGGGSLQSSGLPPPTATVYRLTVRVQGPRNTQIFLQSTFTKPD